MSTNSYRIMAPMTTTVARLGQMRRREADRAWRAGRQHARMTLPAAMCQETQPELKAEWLRAYEGAP